MIKISLQHFAHKKGMGSTKNGRDSEMDYMTLKEAAEKWGVTPRRVNYYCAGGRIPGAVKMAGVWLIPKTAEKPIDGRTKQGKEQKHE